MERQMVYSGGYYLIRRPLIQTGMNEHTAADTDAIPDRVLVALNTVQETAWVINKRILAVMEEAWEADVGEVIPPAEAYPMPERIPDFEFDSLSPSERKALIDKRREIQEENRSSVGKRLMFLNQLKIAKSYSDEPVMYFPYFLDFRGRLYPMHTTLGPQGNDTARGVLQFAQGKRLGQSGLYWLAIRLANTFGQDKLSFSDRIKWVMDHEHLILDSARAPLDGERFWFEAKDNEPWSFLATAMEWEQAHRLTNPEDYVSHLPIPLDGTCSGLQLLSLVGRDPIGGLATNVTASPERHDLYADIAAKVKQAVSQDAAAGVKAAHAWLGHVKRSTVKRAVMTTPYGVTRRGIERQLITDGHIRGLEGSVPELIRYMTTKIIEALEGTIVKAKEIMTYIQGCAGALCDIEEPLQWITPSGMRVTQRYNNLAEKRVETTLGRFVLYDDDCVLGIDRKKQMLASAPNFVHSLDASLMHETILRCRKDGLRDFALVHDSYAVHACNTGLLGDRIRESAYEMFSRDILADFEGHILSYAPDARLPNRPSLGDLDVKEILEAQYFVS